MRRQWKVRVSVAMLGALAVPLAMSCGGDDNKGDGDNGGTGGIILFGDGGSALGSGVGASNPGTCTPPADDTGCVGAAYEGESIPLDIYIMFDLSCSMSCSIDDRGCCIDYNPPEDWRLQPVRNAMVSFLQDPASAGIGMGLGFFGNHDVNNPNDPEMCTPEHHEPPVVEIASMPGNSDALVTALENGTPQGGTPTHLAIEGACAHVAGWKAQHSDHKVVILLVTDGIPEHSCNANIRLATESATECYDDGHGFQTYVLGIESNNNNQGSSLDQLNQIAEAGGTNEAYLSNTQDVAGSVLAALNAIRADAVIPCDMTIPDPPSGETLDPAMFNLGICDPNGEVIVTPFVADADDCGSESGWYYNDNANPETVHLCDATCEAVGAPGSTLYFSMGCKTVGAPLR